MIKGNCIETIKKNLKIMVKKFYIAVVAALMSVAAFAQDDYKIIDSTYSRVELDDDSLYYDEGAYLDDYSSGDNWFIGGSAGYSLSMSENTRFGKFFDNLKPGLQIHVGKWLWPSFGIRLSAGVHPQVGRMEWSTAQACEKYGAMADHIEDMNGNRLPRKYGYEHNYNFNVFAGYFDGLINFTNVFYKYKESRKLNVVGIIGFGFNRSFGFEKDKLKHWETGIRYVDKNGKTIYENNFLHYETEPASFFAAHVGLQGLYKLNNAWDIYAEATFNGTDDMYNGLEYDRVYDTYVDLQIGAQFHFKDSHGRRRFHYVKHYNAAIVERLDKMIDDETENLNEANNLMPDIVENVNLTEALQTTISFYVDRYYITDAQKKNVKSVAKFLETHPDINLIVTGYADIETAYPAYNLRLSQKRAKTVYDMLVDEFNVPKNRLRIDYKGDTVQPYESVNEWNRAVIFFLDRDGGKSQILESAQ